MKASDQKRYHAHEFARLAGVTVRALHHYDRLGLLKPAGRSGAGYRLYAAEDFAALQQIVTLKFIGFTLREIKRLMAGADLSIALRLQRAVLEQKRRQMDQAIQAISEAQQLPGSRRGSDWQAFANIIQRIHMQTNNELAKQYYNEEAQKALAERGRLWSPELQKKVSREWTKLLADMKEAIANGLKPESPEGQILAGRWNKLLEGFTGGHAGIHEGVGKMWANVDNLPAEIQRNMEPFKDAMNPEITAFIARAKAVGVNR
ncbi:MAG TPA: MerR family transcriptional regulator [Alphaproteobacteria bacterium]|nr:MerR family transcriptional regulator [Alphaproteobacteria bacterium]